MNETPENADVSHRIGTAHLYHSGESNNQRAHLTIFDWGVGGEWENEMKAASWEAEWAEMPGPDVLDAELGSAGWSRAGDWEPSPLAFRGPGWPSLDTRLVAKALGA